MRRDVHDLITERCKFCGFLPVRLDETFLKGRKMFLFVCPNEHCLDGINASASREQMDTKAEAADVWNLENKLPAARF